MGRMGSLESWRGSTVRTPHPRDFPIEGGLKSHTAEIGRRTTYSGLEIDTMKTLKIAAMTLALQLGFIGFAATAFGQTKYVNSPKTCTVHVLTQGGSPTAQTVLVCG